MGGDDFQKNDGDFLKGDQTSKGEVEMMFESEMGAVNHKDEIAIREALDSFSKEINNFGVDDSSGNFTIDARIRADLYHLVHIGIEIELGRLEKLGEITQIAYESDWDRKGRERRNWHISTWEYVEDGDDSGSGIISKIRISFGDSEIPPCPCCKRNDHVERERVYGSCYICRGSRRSGGCSDLRFTVSLRENGMTITEPYIYGTRCNRCGNSSIHTTSNRDDAWFGLKWVEDFIEGDSSVCDRRGSNLGCGQFYCEDCQHYVNTDGNCVDDRCSCDDGVWFTDYKSN